jgi:hypothetical protein
MPVLKPSWSSWSYLLYAGAFTIAGALSAALAYLSGAYGDAAYAGWALFLFAAAAAVALQLRRDGAHPIAAGLLAVVALSAFAGFLFALWRWFGWIDANDSSAFRGFDVARIVLVAALLAAAVIALRLFRFPLLMLSVVGLGWFLITDVVSGGGDWSAVVTFAVGLAFLLAAAIVDGGPNRPYGMWLHIGAGLTVGGSIIWFLHSGDVEWALVAVGGVLFIGLAETSGRSSWAVLGSIGILAAGVHFATSLTHARFTLFFGEAPTSQGRGWAPAVVFALTGALLMLLGGALARRSAKARAQVGEQLT